MLTGGITAEYDAGSSDVYCDINLGAAQTIVCPAGAYISLHGNLNLGSHTLTVDGGSVGLHGAISGAGGLTQSRGTVFLTGSSGNNTYTGRTWVQDGTLHLGKGNFSAPSLAVPGPLVVGGGGVPVDSAVVRVFHDNQIGWTGVTVHQDGLLYLQSASDEIRSLSLDGGHVKTDPYPLTVTEGVTNRVAGATATIEGKLKLGAGGCVFEVENSPVSPDLRVTAVISGGSLTKTGSGALSLDADNTGYGGTVTVNAGLVYLNHDLALGSTAAGTVVNDRGVLVLLGGRNISAEPLTLNGGGGMSGALASSADVNSWAGPITLASDSDITVRSGSSLTLSGVISGPGGFTKAQRDDSFYQTGTLILSGTADNTFEGDTFVDAGILEMDKLGAHRSIPGTLHVSNSSGASHSVVARNKQDLEVWGGSVVVNASGLYDLNGFNETINDLTLNLGGDVQTGAGTLTLMSSSTVTVNPSQVSYTGAKISGKLNVTSGSRVFNIGFGYRLPGNPPHLVIDAVISGSATIVKTGAGEMELAAANDFTGAVTLNAGSVCMTHASALGTTAGGTTVNNDAKLLLSGDLAVGNEALTLNSTAAGALSASDGNSSWAGNLTLAADARISVATGKELDLRGAIGGAGGLTKEGAGRLLFTGSAANTYAGATRVHAGMLLLSKTAVNGAVPGDLFIGDGVGAAETDVVFVDDWAQIHDDASVTIANSGKLQLSGIVGTSEDIGLLNGSGVVHLGSSELQVGKNVACTYNGTIQGAGKLTKEGAATFTLTGANTYSGQTTVKEGKLIVNGSQPASQVVVQSGAALGGNGTVGPIAQLFGSVAPGASLANPLGRLTCGGLVLSAASANLDFELNGPTAGTGHDQLVVRGPVTLGELGQPRIKVGYAPTEGDQFTIIDNDHAVGDTFFAGLTEGATLTAIGPNPLKFRITYRGGSDRKDVVLTLIDTALRAESLAVLTGNGNGVMDPNECNTLNVVLRNRNAATVTGIQTVLTTTTPGVWITQAESPYPDLPPGETRTNSRPFQISLAPDFVCGTEVQLALAVTTAAHGQFTVRLNHTAGCEDGGGHCLPCPNQEVRSTLAVSDPQTQQVLVQDGAASTCGAAKECPGFDSLGVGRYRYHTYTFQNGAAEACVTVELPQAGDGVYSVAYTNQFLPDGPCLNYWADAGRIGPARYGFQVGARAVFTVVVAGPPLSDYTLRVSGGSCQPWINIAPTGDQRVVLSWPNFASDFHLEATNAVQVLTRGLRVPDPVFGIGRECVVTNDCTPPRRFYQLHKP